MRLPAADYPFTNPIAGVRHDDRARTVLLMRVVSVVMFAVGAAMVSFSVATEQTAPGTHAHEALIGLAIAEAALAVLFAAVRRPPGLLLLGAPFLGVLCVTAGVGIVATSRPTALYYLWPLLAGALFLRGRALASLFAFFVVTYTVALVTLFPMEEKAGWWADVVGATGLVTLIIYVLKVRVGVAVAELRGAALTDGLTGAPNRTAFETALQDALTRAEAAGGPCAVVAVDIDDFKHVNDRFGHAAGDRALQRIATLIDGAVPRGATFARIGGEEFALVVPGAHADAARLVGEAVRVAVEQGMRGSEPPLTVSVGVAGFPAAGATPSSVMLAADRALYAAKAAGRNRVVAFGGDASLLNVA